RRYDCRSTARGRRCARAGHRTNAQTKGGEPMAIEQIKVQAQKVQEQAQKLTTDVTASARQVFLAGLGAFSLVEQEGEKLLQGGGKLFEDLVARGKKVEAAGKKRIADGRKQVETARKKTEESFERLQDEVSE